MRRSRDQPDPPWRPADQWIGGAGKPDQVAHPAARIEITRFDAAGDLGRHIRIEQRPGAMQLDGGCQRTGKSRRRKAGNAGSVRVAGTGDQGHQQK
ncbi:hypothetical protein OEG84_03115 [Hoeflea sp. G2-23]|uniref:Uncharacterized protein n=1 Tax=Hoeflea algicola TaxID=2983763 RepID=A0ABT3Z4U0_9HYPH|nr:hypothetical protein [Hoeflea algicola]MCY0146731.1 hypothetical protein [Hoeflea algicola]